MSVLSGSARPHQRYSPSGLRSRARALHRPRVLWVNTGWLCVLAATGLCALGIAAIETTASAYALRQMVFWAVGVLAAAVVAAPHYRWAEVAAYPLLAIVLGLLILVLVPFVPEAIVRPRNGARRWINLFITDLQPSELAKIGYIIALAAYLRRGSSYRTFRGLLAPLLLTFIPLGLVLVEPDLGTSLLFLPTFFAMMVAAGAKMRHVLLIGALGLALAPMMYPLLRPHQKDRIRAMTAQVAGDPRYEDDIGFQGAQAMTLVGAGGVLGAGKAHARALVHYNRLPEDHNDMIFAVICCRWGMLGAAATWGLYLLLALGGVLTAGQCKDPFGRLAAVGIIALLLSQMVINTGMTIGLLPITGLTLPFISYGGSSMVTTWLMVGLLLNIAMRRARYLARHSFEFDEATPRL